MTVQEDVTYDVPKPLRKAHAWAKWITVVCAAIAGVGGAAKYVMSWWSGLAEAATETVVTRVRESLHTELDAQREALGREVTASVWQLLRGENGRLLDHGDVHVTCSAWRGRGQPADCDLRLPPLRPPSEWRLPR